MVLLVRAGNLCLVAATCQPRVTRDTKRISTECSLLDVKLGTTERDFVDFRTARDKVLKAPRLIHPSLQVNVRAGRLPPPDPATGLSYFRTPLCGALDI